MHLKSIRIRGFKSFPEPVELRLEPGVAVVVGPNGSGKSNVADAVVWAAGSLSPSELRAEKPDDVLFAGGRGRDPADFCEVELVFDNASGEGPLPYAEVSIARRLHRGGEGQYLLNGTSVRRIDLVELLADVGLGGAMHSIVGQGRVEEILGASPERRRALVEEAAGLGRFKRRRHRAELKLARVAAQLERAHDLEAEVRGRLRPLALQASAAERAERLGRQAAALRARIAELDLDACAGRRTEADERRTAASVARRLADERLQALLADRARAEEELADAAGNREAAVAALYRLRSARERVQLRRERAQELAAEIQAELSRPRPEAPGAAELEAARAALSGAERTALAAAKEIEAVAGRQSELEEAVARERVLEEAVRRSATSVRLATERLADRREAAAALLEAARGARARAEKAARTAAPDPRALERAADEAAAAARAAARERDALAEETVLTRERVAAVERALAAREGLPPAVRALADDGATLAVSRLEVEPGDERAVAAALRWRVSALVTEDAQAALELVERVRSGGLGSVVVLVGDRAQALARELPIVPLERLLEQEHAAVTREGHGYDPEHGELWFAGETAESVLLELERRSDELASGLRRLEREHAAAAERAERAQAEAARAEEAFVAAAPLLRGPQLDPAFCARLVVAGETLDGVLEQAVADAGRIGDTLAVRERAAGERRTVLGTDASELAAAGRRAQEAVREAEHALAAARERSSALEGRATASRFDPVRLEDAAGATERLLDALDASARTAERLEPSLRARADAGGERTAALAEELRRLGAAEVELRRAAGETAERVAAADVELARIDAEAAEARRRLDEAGAEPAEGDDRDALAERVERAERRREELGRVNPLAREEYERERARLEELQEQRADVEASLAELERLRSELTDTVERRFQDTFAAVETHFREVAAALFPGGEGRLRLTEEAEDEEGASGGTETPSTGPPPRTGRSAAGIEVELRPAGKRITRLSLLSGGEKALGAISFLFALFLARPCPFYLLDEVEAALDDANIGRFVALLRRYADRAQFVVITHQKRTIEAADVLYGVTMGADGVSQVVSRRLPPEDVRELATA